ncbi:MAG: hydroxymethylbilane synthase [Parachlamydiaceae bacterium]
MQCLNNQNVLIEVGARASALSKAQVKEIEQALQLHHPHIHFDVYYMSTIGDRDHTTSLRSLDRTDFFTQEIDQWVLKGTGRLGIHSAKDLPASLNEGLSVFCLTKGIDPSDSLVLRSDTTLDQLPIGATIATSSIRREETVRQLRSHLNFCDIRGTIEQRLAKLQSKEIDGVVIAEAALIRLGLTHLNRISLPGETVQGQGQLAVVGRKEELCLKKVLRCLDCRENG